MNREREVDKGDEEADGDNSADVKISVSCLTMH
jgi:hypothetical protein